jgi:cell division GTPase FtsZ
MDAGDIKQSLNGISAIGRGQIDLSTFKRKKKEHFRQGAKEMSTVAGALDKAMQDARRILVLLTAPRGAITLNAVEEVATLLQDRAPKAVVRIGDYPRRTNEVCLTLVASGLASITRVENLYLQATELLKKQAEIEEESRGQVQQLQHTGDNLPTLD